MAPKFDIEQRGADWCVTGRGRRTVYCDPSYAKVAGVFDFITKWGGFRDMNKAEAAEAASNATSTHGRED